MCTSVHQCLQLDALQNPLRQILLDHFPCVPYHFQCVACKGVFNGPGVSCLGTQQQQPAKCASSWTPVHLHLGHRWPLTSTPNPLVGRVKASNVAPYIVGTVQPQDVLSGPFFRPSFSSMPMNEILTLGFYFHLCFDRQWGPWW